jgi:hypothetical protein
MGLQQPPSPEAEMGALLHKAIEHYHKGIAIPPMDYYVKDMFDQYTVIYNAPKDYDLCEFSFTIPIIDPSTKKDTGFIMRGKIDLLRDDTVIDHKTAKSMYTQAKVDNHFQINAYAYWFWRTYKKDAKGIRFNLFVKNKVPKLVICDSYVDFNAYVLWFDRVNKIIEGIKNEKFEPSYRNWHYYDICEGNRSKY